MGPLLEVQDVTFSYPGAQRPAIDCVSFRMQAGERVALLGPNGAGKSTLLLHLNGLLLPQRGAVMVDALEVNEQNGREVRRRVGLVFQDPDDQLFLPTLLEDVTFGPLNEGRSPAESIALARAQLSAFQLEPRSKRAAHHLSGGEKRLASLATVLVTQPKILALDEPTGGLDARSRSRVVQLLRERTETLILATHDLEVAAALATRAIVLDGGELVADAPIEKITLNPDFLLEHGLASPLS